MKDGSETVAALSQVKSGWRIANACDFDSPLDVVRNLIIEGGNSSSASDALHPAAGCFAETTEGNNVLGWEGSWRALECWPIARVLPADMADLPCSHLVITDQLVVVSKFEVIGVQPAFMYRQGLDEAYYEESAMEADACAQSKAPLELQITADEVVVSGPVMLQWSRTAPPNVLQ
eukprot:gene1092-1427_t